jgi:hypothetical protein
MDGYTNDMTFFSQVNIMAVFPLLPLFLIASPVMLARRQLKSCLCAKHASMRSLCDGVHACFLFFMDLVEKGGKIVHWIIHSIDIAFGCINVRMNC